MSGFRDFGESRVRGVSRDTSEDVAPPLWLDGYFVKGPLPLDWWSQVFRLNGSGVLRTALALWFLAGREGRINDLNLSGPVARLFALSPNMKCRSLAVLEKAGLVTVVKRREKTNPLVSIVKSWRDRSGQ